MARGMVAEIYCAADASQMPADHCEPGFREKGGNFPPVYSITPLDNSRELSCAIVNNTPQPGFVELRCLLRRSGGSGLRDRADLSRIGRDAIGKVHLPAALEIVNVHYDFGRTGAVLDRFS
jgi:hypothetical protein